jgi:YVTN family beta-propeller protein
MTGVTRTIRLSKVSPGSRNARHPSKTHLPEGIVRTVKTPTALPRGDGRPGASNPPGEPPHRQPKRPKQLRLGFVPLLAVLVLIGTGVVLWRTGVIGTGGQAGTGAALGTKLASPSVGPPSPAISPQAAASPSPKPTISPTPHRRPSSKRRLALQATIHGNITPKSVVASGDGLVFAQNMMYRHTITVYNRRYHLVKTISDSVELGAFGYTKYAGVYQGAPVEAAFSPDGGYAYVSNYSMFGSGFDRPGADSCSPASGFDDSFVYRIELSKLAIDRVIAVGSVPKFLAVTPNDRYVLVSNWCSFDLSVISARKGKTVKTLYLGAHPRGIAVNSDSSIAYVAIMGSTSIAKVHLDDFHVTWIYGVGSGPRHLVLDPAGRYLYVTLNSDGMVAKIDVRTNTVVDRVSTGEAPRSMAIAEDGKALYVVNYESGTVSKVRTSDMHVIQVVSTNFHPIGITFDAATARVWVACYSGSIMVFRDA